MPTTEVLRIGELQVEVEYKQVKTLRMTIYPPGAPGAPPGEGIRISAPLHTSRQFIQNFVISKAAWIEKHRARFRRNPGFQNPPSGGEMVLIWGRPHRLELAGPRGRPGIELRDGRVLLFLRPGEGPEEGRKLLDRWYRRAVKEAAGRLVPLWAARIGVTVGRVYYQKMKTHWGSCNYGKKTIRLNTELGKRSPQCLEYVVIHELIHILEPSHNRNFYRLMDKHLPAWKTIRKQMNRGEI